MAEDSEDFRDIFDGLFPDRAQQTAEQQAIGYLRRENERISKTLAEMRSEASKTRRQVRSVKNASAALLAPIMLGGIVALVELWQSTNGDWSKLGVVFGGIVAVWWFRDVARQFDDATAD